ncbi:MAG: ATP-binding cassette domain-containing protein [Phycisphaerales bacterium]|nr:MAG: ATP-binding cassette domain-containing protein [Phycisphaerales bacterium]
MAQPKLGGVAKAIANGLELVSMEPAILDIRDVSYKIGERFILDKISWRLQKGEHWAVLGPNGAGKTTLLKIACGYIWANAGGQIYRQGRTLVNLIELRKSIGWVTISLTDQIPPGEAAVRTVVSGKFAQIGLREFADQELDEADFDRAGQYLAEMGCAHTADQRFGTLSQGEKQRVLIARARMARPLLLILDEPCAGLDPGGRELLLDSIQNLTKIQPEMGLVLVTHHIEEIMPVFENVLVLAEGRIIAAGPTRKIITPRLIWCLYGVQTKVHHAVGRYWMIRD